MIQDKILRLQANVPATMRGRRHWLLWKLIQKDGQPKPAKVPYSPHTLQACNPTDLPACGTLEEAIYSWEKMPRYFDGLGYSLQGGLTCIDLDNCLTEDGQPLPWAMAILEQLPASYSEVSQSGRGLHWFGWADVPGDRQKFNLPDYAVEIYSQKRFIAMTGDLFQEAPTTLTDGQTAVDALYSQWMKAVEKPAVSTAPTLPKQGKAALPLSDSALLQKMFQAKNGAEVEALWQGNTSQYHDDESAADLALMMHLRFWCNGDRYRMETLFGQHIKNYILHSYS